ncbi:MAG: SCO family protein [Pseudomonadales bacterium]
MKKHRGQVVKERRGQVVKIGAWVLTISFLVFIGGCADDGMDWHSKNISGLMPELSFELTDETGELVTAERYRGKIVMMFFGFTNCPHYCPATLSKLSQVLNQLPDGIREDVRVLFVSVDPTRDSVEDIATYTDNFASEVIGFTGTENQLRELAKRYRTTFSYGKPNDKGNYDVSHGLAIYVFDRSGKARLMILEDQPIETITADVKILASPE